MYAGIAAGLASAGGSIAGSEGQKAADRKARRRGSQFMWGADKFGNTGKPLMEGGFKSFAEYLGSALAQEEGSLKGLDQTAHRQFSEQHTQRGAQEKQALTSRGLSGTRAAGISQRGLSRDKARGHADVSARLAPLYQQMLQSHRGAMSELYRKEFGLLTGFQSSGVGGGMG